METGTPGTSICSEIFGLGFIVLVPKPVANGLDGNRLQRIGFYIGATSIWWKMVFSSNQSGLVWFHKRNGLVWFGLGY